MKSKKMLILGSYQGIIYYSWLFVIFFLGAVIGLEFSPSINPVAIILLGIFIILVIYSLRNTYLKEAADQQVVIKVPYLKKITVAKSELQLTSGKHFTKIVLPQKSLVFYQKNQKKGEHK